MMHFNGDRHHHAAMLVCDFPKYDSGNRLSAPWGTRMHKACKTNPRQRGVINDVVTHRWLQIPSSGSPIVHSSSHFTHELIKTSMVIKICVGETLIRQ